MSKRVLTAALLIPPVFGLVYLGRPFTTLLALLLSLIANYEFFGLGGHFSTPRRYQMVSTLFLPPLAYLVYGSRGLFPASVLAAMLILLECVSMIDSEKHEPDILGVMATVCIGFLYPGLFGVVLLVVADVASVPLVFWLLLCVIATDTAAYFIGRAFGREPLALRLSAKKTVAGAVGGLCAATLVSVAIYRLPETAGLGFRSSLEAGAWGILVGVFCIYGDLVESAIKRAFGAKDSGRLLPGHGGILDRVDGLLFAAPVVLLILALGR